MDGNIKEGAETRPVMDDISSCHCGRRAAGRRGSKGARRSERRCSERKTQEEEEGESSAC